MYSCVCLALSKPAVKSIGRNHSVFYFSKCTFAPTIDGAILRSKPVDGSYQAHFPVTLVDLAVRSFPCFFFSSRNFHKYVLGSLRKTPTEGILPTGPGPSSGQLVKSYNPTQSNLTYFLELKYFLQKSQ